MIRPLPGWMLIAPLNHSGANAQLKVGVVHSIGDLPPNAPVDELPFEAGDRICWIEGSAPAHVLNETLLLVHLSAPIAWEPADDIAKERQASVDGSAGRLAEANAR